MQPLHHHTPTIRKGGSWWGGERKGQPLSSLPFPPGAPAHPGDYGNGEREGQEDDDKDKAKDEKEEEEEEKEEEKQQQQAMLSANWPYIHQKRKCFMPLSTAGTGSAGLPGLPSSRNVARHR